MIRYLTLSVAALSLASCGGDLAERGLNIVLNEPTETSSGQFPRFTPLLQSPQAYALQATLVDSGVQGGFLLESRRGTIESWLGNDGIGLTFDRGLLHGTRGLNAGLLASDVTDTAALVLSGRAGMADRIMTYLDGNDRAQIRAYRCEIKSQGPQALTLDNGPAPTRLMSEDCNSLDESFQNLYWVDTRSNLIVQSRQWTGAEYGQMDIRVIYNFR
jgi:hypothetical protein